MIVGPILAEGTRPFSWLGRRPQKRRTAASNPTFLVLVSGLAIACGAPDAEPADLEGEAAALGADVVEARPGPVTLEYVAHAAFRIGASDGTWLLVDPYESRWWLGYDFPMDLPAVDAVLLSHPHPDHDAGYAAGRAVPWSDDTPVLTDPGEVAVGGIRVTGIEGKHADPYGEEFGQKNTVWLIEVDDLRIVHIGDNGPLTDEIAARVGRVDILLLPVDDVEHILTHEAVAEYMERLAPAVVIPMHYRHDDLEVDPESPRDLKGIDGWFETQPGARRLGTHSLTFDVDDLPRSPTVWVFDRSPLVVPPGG